MVEIGFTFDLITVNNYLAVPLRNVSSICGSDSEEEDLGGTAAMPEN